MSLKHCSSQGNVMIAKTLSGTNVTINDSDIVIVDGKPVIAFFVVDSNGQHGIFNQNQLTDYQEV
jgi:hypothetical protein